MRLLIGLLASCAIAAFVAACGDVRSGPRASGPDVDAAVPSPAGDAGADSPDADSRDADVDGLRFDEQVSLRSAPLPSGGVLLLLERPLALRTEWGSPQREVRWLDAKGRTVLRYAAPAQRELVDVTLHPSGEVTVLLASKDGYVLHRLNEQALLLGQTMLDDAALATDPPALKPGESTSPIEAVTHDAARLAAVGEDVVLGARTGRHSVVAYRVAFDEGAFAVRWRTMVEPAMDILPIGLTGGTYDTFGQLEGQHSVHVGVDREERVYVAIRHPHGLGLQYVEAHDEVFGEKLVTDPDGMDLFVTRLTSQGVRLGTSVVGTPQEDELYGLRVFEDAAYVVGRTEHWNAQGTGWDALVGRVDAVTGAASVRELDIDRGDIAFDVARAADGSVVVVGASGYWQNPHGASVSEECNTFVRWLRSDGTVVPVVLPNGPRHSEARAIASLGSDRFIIAGMLDGPGTHTADGDLALLRARGFLVERALPGP